MRHLGIMLAALLVQAAAWANNEAPTTAPDAKSRIGSIVANLFNQPRAQQQQAREQLEANPDLPVLLATLLADADPQVRRTSLILLRDSYGDWPVVSAVQAMLQTELARGSDGDGYIIAACCDILADWPQWDSIPILLQAIRTDHKVASQPAPDKPTQTPAVAVWRQADAALRLISGEWPFPEPDASAEPVAPGSRQDVRDRKQLGKSWGEWWSLSSADSEAVPQVRMELSWASPMAGRTSGQANELEVAVALLWLRPNGNIYYSRTFGVAGSADLPLWRWEERVGRRCEAQLNAIQADAARALAADVAAAAPGTAWAITRPAALPPNWHGRLQVISPYGQSVEVELVELGAPGAARPPATAVEALSELLAIPMP